MELDPTNPVLSTKQLPTEPMRHFLLGRHFYPPYAVRLNYYSKKPIGSLTSKILSLPLVKKSSVDPTLDLQPKGCRINFFVIERFPFLIRRQFKSRGWALGNKTSTLLFSRMTIFFITYFHRIRCVVSTLT